MTATISLGRGLYAKLIWCKRRQKWKLQLRHNHINHNCGYHDTTEKAVIAYNNKAKILWRDTEVL